MVTYIVSVFPRDSRYCILSSSWMSIEYIKIKSQKIIQRWVTFFTFLLLFPWTSLFYHLRFILWFSFLSASFIFFSHLFPLVVIIIWYHRPRSYHNVHDHNDSLVKDSAVGWRVWDEEDVATACQILKENSALCILHNITILIIAFKQSCVLV